MSTEHGVPKQDRASVVTGDASEHGVLRVGKHGVPKAGENGVPKIGEHGVPASDTSARAQPKRSKSMAISRSKRRPLQKPVRSEAQGV